MDIMWGSPGKIRDAFNELVISAQGSSRTQKN